MADKRTLYISLAIIGAVIIYIIASTQGFQLFSTASFEGLSSSECDAKNTKCSEYLGSKGQLLNCHIGSGDTCYCEFRSYASEDFYKANCGTAEPTPVKAAAGDQVKVTTTTQKTTTIAGKEVPSSNINLIIGVVAIVVILLVLL